VLAFRCRLLIGYIFILVFSIKLGLVAGARVCRAFTERALASFFTGASFPRLSAGDDLIIALMRADDAGPSMLEVLGEEIHPHRPAAKGSRKSRVLFAMRFAQTPPCRSDRDRRQVSPA